MRRVVRHDRTMGLVGGVLFAALAIGAAPAQAQTFAVRVQNASQYGRGTITSQPAGIDCTFLGKELELTGTGTCTASFPAGSTVVLSATTKDGTTFGGWTLGCTNTTGDCTLVVDQDKTVGVKLNPALYKVTLELSGNGSGLAVDNNVVPALSCSITLGVQSGTCARDYPLGSVARVELRPPLLSGTKATFESSGCGLTCGFAVNGPLTIRASFISPELRVAGAGTGSGRVVASGSKPFDCTVTATSSIGTCLQVYDQNPPPPTTFTPIPAEGSIFVGWSGMCSGSGACTVSGTWPPNSGVVARFDAQPAGIMSLFLTSSGGFGRARVTSNPAGIDCDFSNPTSTQGTGTCRADFPVNSNVQLIASPRDGTKVLGFVGDCVATGETCTLAMYHDRRVTVQLDPARFPVTIVGAGNGTGKVNSVGFGNDDASPPFACDVASGVTTGVCTSTYPFGGRVRIVGGSGNSGSSFGGFSVPPCADASSCNVTVTGPMTITATFNGPAVLLRLSGEGNGSGTVTSSPAGLTCPITNGLATYPACDAFFETGTSATLTATASPGSQFLGWADNCSSAGTSPTCTLTFSSIQTVIARFQKVSTPTPIVLTIAGGGTGAGVVAVSPNGAHCAVSGGVVVGGVGCSTTFSQPVDVTLTAEVQPGSTFIGWSGACNNAEPTCTFNLSASRTVTASFGTPHSAVNLTQALAGHFSLTPDERAEMDRLGNNNGRFDLGDVLAYLDRTKQSAPTKRPTDIVKPKSSVAPAAKTRRAP